MALPAGMGGPGWVLPRARVLFLFEAPSPVEAGGARARPARPASLSVKPTRGRAAGLAPGTFTMRAGLYARVSTQAGHNPEMQLRELREYCQRREWEVANEYVDLGVSGAKEKRPELDRLMADAHRRRFDAVVVWRFDRFARSVSHLLRALETFKALGIESVSLSEQVDTSTPTGKFERWFRSCESQFSKLWLVLPL